MLTEWFPSGSVFGNGHMTGGQNNMKKKLQKVKQQLIRGLGNKTDKQQPWAE